MNNYILYSLPLYLANSQDLEAIENKNYFKALVNYIDGNTVRIVYILNIHQDFINCCDYLKMGTTIELYRLKHFLQYYSPITKSWIKPDPRLKHIRIITKKTNEIV